MSDLLCLRTSEKPNFGDDELTMSLDESQKLTFQRSIPTVCAVMIKSSFVAKVRRE